MLFTLWIGGHMRPPTMRVMKNWDRKTLSYSVFYEQASEGGFVAFVPALPGCHTQGETLEETDSLAAHGGRFPRRGAVSYTHLTLPTKRIV